MLEVLERAAAAAVRVDINSERGRWAPSAQPAGATYAYPATQVPCEEFETPQKGHKKGGKDAGGGADQALAAAGVDAAASGASGGGTAPLQTLPFTPMAVHATWYYMWGTAQRFADLLTMLETSVCGPVPGGAAVQRCWAVAMRRRALPPPSRTESCLPMPLT